MAHPDQLQNVFEVVPFLRVDDMPRSVAYYVDGLGFTMTHSWIDAGTLRWCRLSKGAASIMLQDFWTHGERTNRPQGQLGSGVSLNFTCHDALLIYRDVTSRGIVATEPFRSEEH